MAFDAMLIHDPSNLVGVGDITGLLLVMNATDKATNCPRDGFFDGLCRQQFVDGKGEVLLIDFGSRGADAVLIVDGAPIADHTISVE